MKACTGCGEVKVSEEFNQLRSACDGLQSRCRECFRAYTRANAAAGQARAAKFRAQNPDYGKQWARANTAKRVASTNRWRKKNPGNVLAKNAQYRAAKRATRVDQDPRIDAIYVIAAWLRSKGDDVHVDHVVPLSRGGHHVYENLQILTAFENMSKGDKLEPRAS